MFFVLTVIAPVFAIIMLGYLAGRTGYLSEQAGRGIAEFAFNITIPALLFRTILLAGFGDVAPVGIIGSFFGSAAIVWVTSALVTRFVLRRPAADGPAIAVCSVFGNTIMLGLPIGVATFGPDALAPISVILGIHAPVFLVSATLHTAAVADKNGATLRSQLASVARQLVRQPLIVAIACATLWRVSGVPVPGPVLTMVEMLAKAGVPAALVALGLSLQTFQLRGDVPTLTTLVLLKLVMMPLVAAALATQIFHLPPVSTACVVLMSALPAGANAYLFAANAGRAMNSASGAVAIGTAISSLTLAAMIILYHG